MSGGGSVTVPQRSTCAATNRHDRRHGSLDFPLSMRDANGHVPKSGGDGRLMCALCLLLLPIATPTEENPND